MSCFMQQEQSTKSGKQMDLVSMSLNSYTNVKDIAEQHDAHTSPACRTISIARACKARSSRVNTARLRWSLDSSTWPRRSAATANATNGVKSFRGPSVGPQRYSMFRDKSAVWPNSSAGNGKLERLWLLGPAAKYRSSVGTQAFIYLQNQRLAI